MKGYRSQTGFTLIEALIALVVLSIGLLGVAAMQLKALQSAHMGYQRSVVSLVAIDAQERVWAALSELGSCPDASALSDIEGAWLSEWFGTILVDDGTSLASSSGCGYSVSIEWQEGRYSIYPDGTDETGVAFIYQFRLPVVNP